MLIARAPVRLSFCGGGTDLPVYYERFGGLVVSTTIDKYFYVFLEVNDEDTVQVSSSDYRTFFRGHTPEAALPEQDLSLPRMILEHFDITRGVSLFLASQVPPGTGLGSSSAVAVAIIKAISIASDLDLTKEEVAEIASHIEIERLGMPIGKQDQYASSFGGLNVFSFDRNGVIATRVELPQEILRGFEERLMLFFTGTARQSTQILKRQSERTSLGDQNTLTQLHATKNLVQTFVSTLTSGHLDQIGDILHAAWLAKRSFAEGATNELVDQCYDLALRCGATGGKLVGAGGGGFLALYCEPRFQPSVAATLSARGLRRMNFRFDTDGARVLLNTGLQLQERERLRGA